MTTQASHGSQSLGADETAPGSASIGALTAAALLRAGAAAAGSLLLHASAALIVLLTFSSDQGRSKSHSESLSLEAVETFIVQADTEVSNDAAPASSMAQRSTSAEDNSKNQPGPEQKSPDLPERVVLDQSQWPKLAFQAPPEVPPPEIPPLERQSPAIAPDAFASTPAKPDLREPPEEPANTDPTEDRKEPKRQEPPRPERETARSAREPREEKRKVGKRAKQTQSASVASRGSGKNSGGHTTANHGDMVSYRALVQARVARNSPTSNGHRGTAHVSFVISSSGSLASARLTSSSGSSDMDRAAVAAVRGAGPFPPTPHGSAISFGVDIHFR